MSISIFWGHTDVCVCIHQLYQHCTALNGMGPSWQRLRRRLTIMTHRHGACTPTACVHLCIVDMWERENKGACQTQVATKL